MEIPIGIHHLLKYHINIRKTRVSEQLCQMHIANIDLEQSMTQYTATKLCCVNSEPSDVFNNRSSEFILKQLLINSCKRAQIQPIIYKKLLKNRPLLFMNTALAHY